MRKSPLAGGLLLAAYASAAHAADLSVDQQQVQFSLSSLTAHAGDTVHFNNKDTVVHNIRIKGPDGSTNDRGIQKPGEDIAYTFNKPGKYDVSCAIHPAMKLTVTVKE